MTPTSIYIKPLIAIAGSFLVLILGAACTGSNPQPDPDLPISKAQWSGAGNVELVKLAKTDPKFDSAINANASELALDQLAAVGLVLTLDSEGAEQDELRGWSYIEAACGKGQMRACAYFGSALIKSEDRQDWDQGLTYLSDACDANIGWACSELVYEYTSGRRFDRDFEQAAIFADLACLYSEQYSCAYAAMTVAAADVQLGLSLSQRGCEANGALACDYKGNIVFSDQYGLLDYPAAAKAYEAACFGGIAVSCGKLHSLMAAHNVVLTDKERFLARATELCELGSGEMCTRQARYYSDSNQSSEDASEALTVKFSMLACHFDQVQPCRWMAERYRDGDGVEQDIAKAISLFKHVCQAGFETYCQDAAQLEFAMVEKPVKNLVGNPVWVRACEIGSGEACRSLAWSFIFGEHESEVDLQLAERFFLEACEKNAPHGCVDLGQLYEWSKFGFQDDWERAKTLYRRSCELGDDTGCNLAARPDEQFGRSI